MLWTQPVALKQLPRIVAQMAARTRIEDDIHLEA
jgi:hypothetical protein